MRQKISARSPVRRLKCVPLLLGAGLAGCGGDDPAGPGPGDPQNVPPTLEAIADQALALNTLVAPSVTIDLTIEDPDDDSFAVTAVSDDAAVIPRTELTCGGDPCRLTLTPQATAGVSVTVTVTATDGAGGQATTSFLVRVTPTFVTTALGDGIGSLRQVIADADPGAVIGFDPDGAFASPTTIPLQNQVTLDRDVTIDGTGVTVSGGGADRVFRVENGAVVRLRGVTLADGVAPLESHGGLGDGRLGGCLFVASGSSLTLENVIVTGCDAPADVALAAGGAVANLDGTLLIQDSDVAGNSGGSGGGVATLTSTSGEAATTIIGGRITGNEATSGCGGGIVSHGSLSVESSTIAGNEAAGNDGGGLCNLGDPLTVVDSEVRENVGRYGGGIFSSTTGSSTLVGSMVNGNQAIRGGGIYVDGDEEDWVLSGTAVSSNVATSPEESHGGGINFDGNRLAILDSSRIENNLVEQTNATGGLGGGVRFLGQMLEIVESVVSGNSASTGGGLFIGPPVATGSAVLRTALIEQNTARDGGGVYAGRGVLDVAGSVIAGNAASGRGGGVHLNGETVAGFRGTVIEDNSGSRGGGISVSIGNGEPDAILDILDQSSISNNEAETEGGGIYLAGSGDDLRTTIVDSEVTDNSAPLGGGVYLSGAELDVEGASGVRRNEAERGGGLFSVDAAIRLRDPSVVIANGAGAYGGGFYLVDSTLLVVGDDTCLILGNLADTEGAGFAGGGIFHNTSSDISGVPAKLVCFNNPDDIFP